jgi:thioesterase domain-containing protein
VALLVAAAAAATMASAGFEATPFVFLVDPPQPALATISNASSAIRQRFRERMLAIFTLFPESSRL